MENGAFRKKKVYFSQVSNLALRDNALSLKAKGLYALIQSYITIDGFTLYKSMLLKECKESKTAFDGAWKELIGSGYLKQYRIRAEGGMFCYEYELLDAKEAKSAENPGNRPQPQNRGADNPGNGKAGVYSNTDRKNTDLNNTEKEYKASPSNGIAGDVHEIFSDELCDFVDRWYPQEFEKDLGYQHPKLKSYQRHRVLRILQGWITDNDESVDSLEAAAEEFLTDADHGDGNILLFANPDIIEIRLVRCG